MLGFRRDGASSSGRDSLHGRLAACGGSCQGLGGEWNGRTRRRGRRRGEGRVGRGTTRVSTGRAGWRDEGRRDGRIADPDASIQPPKVPLKSKEAIAKAAASSSKGKKKKWSKGKSKEKVNNLVLFDKVCCES